MSLVQFSKPVSVLEPYPCLVPLGSSMLERVVYDIEEERFHLLSIFLFKTATLSESVSARHI